ncbi:hypothetical protein TBLA_0A10740 [Henningerozyma blattae CBS 6284]|uniref:PA14 domain-containing protein n=1 Tax=Henningerozyma blattae (strain ATCC 34711 / CBS 6284 / DSM 70876 / NBRC 10599 / NRRL Y-10934 / UCD 77-7) TaxID=1071380 RepID=I2GXJ9_HENB6|nr:hypothetical protein TBLA_0A10740 [Tetrapisispora blattae CBS 6284]CCH58851.1 hypothetical protein TBLA_0A10740 [Tetrapisispora blattae CBS 6284]
MKKLIPILCKNGIGINGLISFQLSNLYLLFLFFSLIVSISNAAYISPRTAVTSKILDIRATSTRQISLITDKNSIDIIQKKTRSTINPTVTTFHNFNTPSSIAPIQTALYGEKFVKREVVDITTTVIPPFVELIANPDAGSLVQVTFSTGVTTYTQGGTTYHKTFYLIREEELSQVEGTWAENNCIIPSTAKPVLGFGATLYSYSDDGTTGTAFLEEGSYKKNPPIASTIGFTDFGAIDPTEGYVLEFNGYFIPSDTGLYDFQLLDANPAAIVMIANQYALDSKNSVVTDNLDSDIDLAMQSDSTAISTKTGLLYAGLAYPIKIVYYSNQANAAEIRLQFTDPDSMIYPIISNVYYYDDLQVQCPKLMGTIIESNYTTTVPWTGSFISTYSSSTFSTVGDDGNTTVQRMYYVETPYSLSTIFSTHLMNWAGTFTNTYATVSYQVTYNDTIINNVEYFVETPTSSSSYFVTAATSTSLIEWTGTFTTTFATVTRQVTDNDTIINNIEYFVETPQKTTSSSSYFVTAATSTSLIEWTGTFTTTFATVTRQVTDNDTIINNVEYFVETPTSSSSYFVTAATSTSLIEWTGTFTTTFATVTRQVTDNDTIINNIEYFVETPQKTTSSSSYFVTAATSTHFIDWTGSFSYTYATISYQLTDHNTIIDTVEYFVETPQKKTTSTSTQSPTITTSTTSSKGSNTINRNSGKSHDGSKDTNYINHGSNVYTGTTTTTNSDVSATSGTMNAASGKSNTMHSSSGRTNSMTGETGTHTGASATSSTMSASSEKFNSMTASSSTYSGMSASTERSRRMTASSQNSNSMTASTKNSNSMTNSSERSSRRTISSERSNSMAGLPTTSNIISDFSIPHTQRSSSYNSKLMSDSSSISSSHEESSMTQSSTTGSYGMSSGSFYKPISSQLSQSISWLPETPGSPMIGMVFADWDGEFTVTYSTSTGWETTNGEVVPDTVYYIKTPHIAQSKTRSAYISSSYIASHSSAFSSMEPNTASPDSTGPSSRSSRRTVVAPSTTSSSSGEESSMTQSSTTASYGMSSGSFYKPISSQLSQSISWLPETPGSPMIGMVFADWDGEFTVTYSTSTGWETTNGEVVPDTVYYIKTPHIAQSKTRSAYISSSYIASHSSAFSSMEPNTASPDSTGPSSRSSRRTVVAPSTTSSSSGEESSMTQSSTTASYGMSSGEESSMAKSSTTASYGMSSGSFYKPISSQLSQSISWLPETPGSPMIGMVFADWDGEFTVTYSTSTGWETTNGEVVPDTVYYIKTPHIAQSKTRSAYISSSYIASHSSAFSSMEPNTASPDSTGPSSRSSRRTVVAPSTTSSSSGEESSMTQSSTTASYGMSSGEESSMAKSSTTASYGMSSGEESSMAKSSTTASYGMSSGEESSMAKSSTTASYGMSSGEESSMTQSSTTASYGMSSGEESSMAQSSTTASYGMSSGSFYKPISSQLSQSISWLPETPGSPMIGMMFADWDGEFTVTYSTSTGWETTNGEVVPDTVYYIKTPHIAKSGSKRSVSLSSIGRYSSIYSNLVSESYSTLISSESLYYSNSAIPNSYIASTAHVTFSSYTSTIETVEKSSSRYTNSKVDSAHASFIMSVSVTSSPPVTTLNKISASKISVMQSSFTKAYFSNSSITRESSTSFSVSWLPEGRGAPNYGVVYEDWTKSYITTYSTLTGWETYEGEEIPDTIYFVKTPIKPTSISTYFKSSSDIHKYSTSIKDSTTDLLPSTFNTFATSSSTSESLLSTAVVYTSINTQASLIASTMTSTIKSNILSSTIVIQLSTKYSDTHSSNDFSATSTVMMSHSSTPGADQYPTFTKMTYSHPSDTIKYSSSTQFFVSSCSENISWLPATPGEPLVGMVYKSWIGKYTVTYSTSTGWETINGEAIQDIVYYIETPYLGTDTSALETSGIVSTSETKAIPAASSVNHSVPNASSSFYASSTSSDITETTNFSTLGDTLSSAAVSKFTSSGTTNYISNASKNDNFESTVADNSIISSKSISAITSGTIYYTVTVIDTTTITTTIMITYSESTKKTEISNFTPSITTAISSTKITNNSNRLSTLGSSSSTTNPQTIVETRQFPSADSSDMSSTISATKISNISSTIEAPYTTTFVEHGTITKTAIVSCSQSTNSNGEVFIIVSTFSNTITDNVQLTTTPNVRTVYTTTVLEHGTITKTAIVSCSQSTNSNGEVFTITSTLQDTITEKVNEATNTNVATNFNTNSDENINTILNLLAVSETTVTSSSISFIHSTAKNGEVITVMTTVTIIKTIRPTVIIETNTNYIMKTTINSQPTSFMTSTNINPNIITTINAISNSLLTTNINSNKFTRSFFPNKTIISDNPNKNYNISSSIKVINSSLNNINANLSYTNSNIYNTNTSKNELNLSVTSNSVTTMIMPHLTNLLKPNITLSTEVITSPRSKSLLTSSFSKSNSKITGTDGNLIIKRDGYKSIPNVNATLTISAKVLINSTTCTTTGITDTSNILYQFEDKASGLYNEVFYRIIILLFFGFV